MLSQTSLHFSPSSKSESFTPKTSPLQKSVKIVWEETFVETQNPLRVKD